jgi:hypothetical protein
LKNSLKIRLMIQRREIMESQAKILEGSAVGQIIADRQALMALIAYRANRQYAGKFSGVNRDSFTRRAGCWRTKL